MIVQPKMVLVVEDDAALRQVLAEALETEGYVTTQACDASQALQLANTDNPNLILLDVGLPGRSGIELLEEIKGGTPTHSIPVLIMTECALRYADAALGHADGSMPKPFDLDELLARIDQLTSQLPIAVGIRGT